VASSISRHLGILGRETQEKEPQQRCRRTEGSADRRELEAVSPAGADGAGQLGLPTQPRVVAHGLEGNLAGQAHQARVAHQVRDPQIGQASVLARSQELARSPDAQVGLGDPKAVGWEALQIGLVHAVSPSAELEGRPQGHAAGLARQATGAIARIKRCVNTGFHEGLARGLAEEHRAVGEDFDSPDAREDVAAFLTGRNPPFRG